MTIKITYYRGDNGEIKVCRRGGRAMNIRNYYRSDCPVCGCLDTRRNWNDEYGYDYHDCDICGDSKSLTDIAKKFKSLDFLTELYLDGLTKESELKEVYADELFGKLTWVDAGRLAGKLVDLLYDEVAARANEENERAADWSSEYLNALSGEY